MERSKPTTSPKVIWWITVISVLLFTSGYYFYNRSSKDAGEAMLMMMVVLTFPICVLPMDIYGKIIGAQKFSSLFPGYWGFLIGWLVLTAFGYFQWFILVPRFYRWIKRKSKPSKRI